MLCFTNSVARIPCCRSTNCTVFSGHSFFVIQPVGGHKKPFLFSGATLSRYVTRHIIAMWPGGNLTGISRSFPFLRQFVMIIFRTVATLLNLNVCPEFSEIPIKNDSIENHFAYLFFLSKNFPSICNSTVDGSKGFR